MFQLILIMNDVREYTSMSEYKSMSERKCKNVFTSDYEPLTYNIIYRQHALCP